MVDLLIVTHQQTTGTEGQQRGGWVGGGGSGGAGCLNLFKHS